MHHTMEIGKIFGLNEAKKNSHIEKPQSHRIIRKLFHRIFVSKLGTSISGSSYSSAKAPLGTDDGELEVVDTKLEDSLVGMTGGVMTVDNTELDNSLQDENNQGELETTTVVLEDVEEGCFRQET